MKKIISVICYVILLPYIVGKYIFNLRKIRKISTQLQYGNNLYNAKRYEEAIDYYKKALRNTTINEYEAPLYKLNIAKCYKKLGNNKDGSYWLDDAISEVKDNSEMVSELKKQYNAE